MVKLWMVYRYLFIVISKILPVLTDLLVLHWFLTNMTLACSSRYIIKLVWQTLLKDVCIDFAVHHVVSVGDTLYYSTSCWHHCNFHMSRYFMTYAVMIPLTNDDPITRNDIMDIKLSPEKPWPLQHKHIQIRPVKSWPLQHKHITQIKTSEAMTTAI